jgi:hypothetical protein
VDKENYDYFMVFYGYDSGGATNPVGVYYATVTFTWSQVTPC